MTNGRPVKKWPAGRSPFAGIARIRSLGVAGNTVADTSGIKVKRQHPPGSRAGIVDRRRGRLVRRVGGQLAGVPGRVCAAAILGDPDVRSPGDGARDRMPSLCVPITGATWADAPRLAVGSVPRSVSGGPVSTWPGVR